MSPIVTALAPVLFLILLGFVLTRLRFVPEAAWGGIEKLTYFVLFPALLVHNLAGQRLDGVPWLDMLTVIAAALSIAAAALLVLKPFTRRSGPAFTSIFQGGIRFNTYLALAVTQALFGDAGLQIGSVAAGFLIVIINLMCVTAFAIWGSRASGSIKRLLRDVVTNPLIIACVAGGFLAATGTALPDLVDDSFDLISHAALPLGLMTVGAALVPGHIRGHLGAALLASIVQFGLKPLAAILLIGATGLTGIPAAALIIAFVTPAPPSAYILSRQLGGDPELMASIVTVQTLLAFIAIPTAVWLLL